MDCVEVESAADYQESILDAVEVKEGGFLGRVIVEMRVFWVRERCGEPDVGHNVIEARPERASSKGGDCVVGTGVNYEQMC